MIDQEPLNLHVMLQQGITWYNLETENGSILNCHILCILDKTWHAYLQPECNFLHGFFRCKLLVEVVEVEIKITSMQGTHILRRDRTTQLIKCTPWSTRLCLHPTTIKKMKTFLEVEGKMGPIPTPGSQFRPHSQTPIPTSGKTMSLKREREPHLRM